MIHRECPEAETLAALVDGTLNQAERMATLEHLAECPQCLDVVAGTCQTIRELGDIIARPRAIVTRNHE